MAAHHVTPRRSSASKRPRPPHDPRVPARASPHERAESMAACVADDPRPLTPTLVNLDGAVVEATAPKEATCTLVTGAASCWGLNVDGALVNGSTRGGVHLPGPVANGPELVSGRDTVPS
jgi:hypothetical protein